MIRRGLMMRHKGEEYIKDGLVFWLDGRRQGGQPNKWQELIQGNYFDLFNTIQNSDNVELSGQSDSYGELTQIVDYEPSKWDTMECVAEVTTNFDTQILLTGLLNPKCISFYSKKYLTNGYIYQVSNVNKKLSASARNDGVLIFNKDKYTSNQVDAWSSPKDRIMLGKRHINPQCPYKGKIYAIRIYNRQLTEAEILHNQQLDIDNYFGGVIE